MYQFYFILNVSLLYKQSCSKHPCKYIYTGIICEQCLPASLLSVKNKQEPYPQALLEQQKLGCSVTGFSCDQEPMLVRLYQQILLLESHFSFSYWIQVRSLPLTLTQHFYSPGCFETHENNSVFIKYYAYFIFSTFVMILFIWYLDIFNSDNIKESFQPIFIKRSILVGRIQIWVSTWCFCIKMNSSGHQYCKKINIINILDMGTINCTSK